MKEELEDITKDSKWSKYTETEIFNINHGFPYDFDHKKHRLKTAKNNALLDKVYSKKNKENDRHTT